MSLYKIFTRGLLARSLCKLPSEVSWQGLLNRSLYKLRIRGLLARAMQETPWQDLCSRSLWLYAMSLYKISTRGLLARSLYKICIRGLLARSLYEISVEALSIYKSSVGKISVRDLLVRSLYKISTRGLCARSLWEVSVARSLRKLSANPPCQDLCTRSPWLSTWVPPHQERSDRPKVSRGLPSDLKIRTAPPQVWPHCLGNCFDFGSRTYHEGFWGLKMRYL